MTVVVGSAVSPPDGAAFTEGLLGSVDDLAGLLACGRVVGAHGLAFGAAGLHESPGEGLAVGGGQAGIGGAPKAAADDEVTAVRGGGIGRHH